MKIANIFLRWAPAIAVSLCAIGAQAQTATGVTVANLDAGDRVAAQAKKWDARTEKKKSPYYQMEAYLALKPFTQVGNHDEVPALLANGRCSDPAGEGH